MTPRPIVSPSARQPRSPPASPAPSSTSSPEPASQWVPGTALPAHALPAEKALEAVSSDAEKGISQAEAKRRLALCGANQLKEAPKKPLYELFFDQFKESVVLLLIGAGAVTFLIGERLDSAAIFAIVVLNAIFGFVQEYRAEKAIEALRKMMAPVAKAVRDGVVAQVPAAELVPGDVVLLEAGDQVPADCRLAEAQMLSLVEAPLTGESNAVSKDASLVLAEKTFLAERKNLVFAGTTVARGNGRGVVFATGMGTEFGKIAGEMQQVREEATPLEKKLDLLGKKLSVLAVALVLVVFLAGILRGVKLFEMFLTAVSLAVAAVPEGLPAIVTITLAVGVQRMIKRNAVIRKLHAVETLGSADVICSDKTGTLTRNEMTVRSVFFDSAEITVEGSGYEVKGGFFFGGKKYFPSPEFLLFLRAASLCTTAELRKSGVDGAGVDGRFVGAGSSGGVDGRVDGAGVDDGRAREPAGAETSSASAVSAIGDGTEVALVVLAAKAGLEKHAELGEYKKLAEIPFESERKMMSTIHERPAGRAGATGSAVGSSAGLESRAGAAGGAGATGSAVGSGLQGGLGGRYAVFSKGAPEVFLEKCTSVFWAGKFQFLTPSIRKAISIKTDELASRGLRVLAVGSGSLDSLDVRKLAPENVEHELTFLGLVGMNDPPREEARQAIALCRTAGVRVIMVTGDNPLTAKSIAHEIGVSSNGLVLTGADLDEMGDSELLEAMGSVSVLARVSPSHKLRVVAALKQRGHIVAMTGDGVNDAPALKKADIGVAMGITGTDVSKEASDMVLVDDNFASIVAAVEEGRTIFDNIGKSVRYLLSCNSGELVTVFVATIASWPMPLQPLQILWMNLVTDGLPALALGMDPGEPDVMKRPPRDPKQEILTERNMLHLALIGLFMAGVTLALFLHYLGAPADWQENTGKAGTVAFTTLVLLQFVHSFNSRSRRNSLFSIGVFRNKLLWLAVVSGVLLQVAIVQLGVLESVFNTVPLELSDWLLIGAASLSVFFAYEAWKLFKHAAPSAQ